MCDEYMGKSLSRDVVLLSAIDDLLAAMNTQIAASGYETSAMGMVNDEFLYRRLTEGLYYLYQNVVGLTDETYNKLGMIVPLSELYDIVFESSKFDKKYIQKYINQLLYVETVGKIGTLKDCYRSRYGRY